MDSSGAYEDLPADNTQAFVVLEQRYKATYENQVRGSEESRDYTESQCEYMTRVLAAAKALEIDYFDQFSVPQTQNSSLVWDAFRKFEHHLIGYVEQVKIINARRTSYYAVRLTQTEKAKIRHHIEQIKLAVEGSSMTDEKKEAILKKISSLTNEVERDRTKFDIFADFSGRLAQVSKNFAEEGAEPWWKWMKPIFEILGAAKESEEQRTGLPSPPEQKRIEQPKKQLPAPDETGFGQLEDDDVPF